jgi:hypothetical protein
MSFVSDIVERGSQLTPQTANRLWPGRLAKGRTRSNEALWTRF